jgi:hypothetical protein
MDAPTAVELRRGVLAVSVLHDVDIEPARLGIILSDEPEVWVPWAECRRALAGHHPEGDLGRVRLAAWLLARPWAADLGPAALVPRLRPVGLPVEHVLHPGLDWVRRRVLGGVLDLGLGAVGLDPSQPDSVVLLPETVLSAAGIDAELAWLRAEAYLEEMGALAALRIHRDPKGQLRPIGDCDAITLLGARSLRSALVADSGGLGAAVVPMMRRGWTRLALIDPAFGPAAAAATEPIERGFSRPLLLTADEVAVVPEGGSPARHALETPLVEERGLRDVLYR